MIRLFYIAGKYRYYEADGSYDIFSMGEEVEEEQEWCKMIASTGHMWFGPLSNSVYMEDDPPISGDEFIQRDKAVLNRMREGYDGMILRPRWDDEPRSVGATEERECAVENGLLIIPGESGIEAVREYIISLATCRKD